MVEHASLQQLERTSTNLELSGELPRGAERLASPSMGLFPAVDSARRGPSELSRGAEGGSAEMGKDKFHGHKDGEQLREMLNEKEKEIGQLLATMRNLVETNNKLTKELVQVKKETNEIRKRNEDLDQQVRLMRSQQMKGTGAHEYSVGASMSPGQGSTVNALEEEWEEEEYCDSSDSFEHVPEPRNFDTRIIEKESRQQQEGASLSLLQEQIKEHEEAFRKERNDRVKLSKRCRSLERDVRLLMQEKNLAQQRAELAEAEAKGAKEEAMMLKDKLDQMDSFRRSRSASSSHSHSSSTPSTRPEPHHPRDPLTCVWPINEHHLIMPPGYRRPQGGPDPQSGNEGAGDPPGATSRPLQWDSGRTNSKREREMGVAWPLMLDDVDDVKKSVRKLDDRERWPCQACTYRNRAKRSVCSSCGTVDAEQRRRHNRWT